MLGSKRAVVVLAACVLAIALAAPAAAQVSRPCVGSDTICEATFSMSGGATNERLTVRLPDTDLRLLAVNANPAYAHGAYLLTRGRFRQGGSVYTAILDAVQGMPRNARLILTFGHRSAGRACGNIRRGVSFITIAQTGSVRPGSFRCSVASAVGRTWLSRLQAHRSVQRFTAAGIGFRCRLIPLLPQNQQCQGGGLRVRFSGPTGE
jgi:hypothetical protein